MTEIFWPQKIPNLSLANKILVDFTLTENYQREVDHALNPMAGAQNGLEGRLERFCSPWRIYTQQISLFPLFQGWIGGTLLWWAHS